MMRTGHQSLDLLPQPEAFGFQWVFGGVGEPARALQALVRESCFGGRPRSLRLALHLLRLLLIHLGRCKEAFFPQALQAL